MKSYLIEHGPVASATLAIPVTAIAWLVMVPRTMTSGTFAATAAVIIGAAAVAFKTWQSGQATGTIGQVINETEAVRKDERDGQVRRDSSL